MVDQIGQVNLAVVPNFEALDGWVNKLKSWCEQARDEVVNGVDPDTHNRTVEALADARPKADHFDALVELFFDMRRGIREPGEVEAWLKSKGFEA